MRADIERWNAKYASRPARDAIEPDPLLVRHGGLLSHAGNALDVAGGTGDNGLYLAQQGYSSLIVDASETGLRQCRNKARVAGLSPMLVVADLDRFALPEAAFEAVAVFRYLNRALIDPIAAALKPGGLLFFKTFNTQHLESHPGFCREYVLADGELSHWFAGLHGIDVDDGASGAATSHWVGRR